MEPHHGQERPAARPRGGDAQRQALERRVAGQTLCSVLAANARRHATRRALRQRSATGWRPWTWADLRQAVGAAALGLRAAGLRRGDVLLLRAPPRPEALVLDLAALHLRAVPVFVDPGASAAQLEWIARHSGARLLAAAGPVRAPAGLAQVVALDELEGNGERGALPLARLLARGRARLRSDPDALERLARQVRPGDVATLCYVPDPGGGLRAVVVTHRAALWAAASVSAWAGDALRPGARTVTFLPLAHSAGRVFGHYLVLYRALEATCCPATGLLPEALAAARPSLFVAVPLVWERLVAAGGARRVAGLERCPLPVSAGARLPGDLAARLRGAGLPLLDMYGLTETFGPVTAHPPGRPRAGTVGRPLPGVDLWIDGGEVVVRASGGVLGYLRDEAATVRTFGAGGVVRTADLGRLEPDGQLVLDGRRRELLVTAGGRNVAPRPLERALAREPSVERACVLAEGRPFVIAVVAVPPAASGADGRPGRAALEAVEEVVERVNAGLARGDRVRAFLVVPDDWSVAGGELRADGSCDRAAVERRYAGLLDGLEAGTRAAAGSGEVRLVR